MDTAPLPLLERTGVALQTDENGAVISALRFQARQPERVNLYLDGQFAFGLEATQAAALRVGQRLSAEQIAALRQEDEMALALRRALRYLSFRPRSVAEVRRQLRKRKTNDDVCAAALQRLTEQGYLDDVAFARFWLENRAAFRPSSRRALQYELRQKGIAQEIIAGQLADWDDVAAALATLRANERRWKAQDAAQFRQQAGAFLQRRGFGFADAAEAMQIYREGDAKDPDPAPTALTKHRTHRWPK